MISIPRLHNGLKRAHIAGQECEYSDANTALPGNSQNRPLEDAGRSTFVIAGRKKIVVPSSGKMGENNKKGRNSSQTLR